MFVNNWKKSSMRMDILQKRIKQIEISEKIDKALEEYYASKNMPVPHWKKKHPEWWVTYLRELGLDANNRPFSE